MNGALDQIGSNIDSLIYGKDLVVIQGLSGIDLYSNEIHSQQVNLTKLTIESGASITDHAAMVPAKLTIKGIVSNIQELLGPLPFIAGGISIQNDNKPRAAWANIKLLQFNRTQLTVVTALQVYNGMIITNAEAPIDEKTGVNLFFTIDFEQILIVGSQTVQLPPSTLGPIGGNSAKNPAANSTSQVNGGERQSALAGITDGITNTVQRFL